MASKSTFNPNDVYDQYKELFHTYEAVCVYLKNEIEALTRIHDIHVAVPISYRVKQVWSIVQKIQAGRVNIKKDIAELDDFAGVRAILLFNDDAKHLARLLAGKFPPLKQRDASAKLIENQFGYSSLHLVVEVPADVLNLKDIPHSKLKAEIQIRTLSQHSWAEASNLFQYKREENVPSELKRSLSRISAILELVDLEYARMLSQRDALRGMLTLHLYQEEDVQLNTDLLEILLDDVLPKANKIDYEDYAALTDELNTFGISSRNHLTEVVAKYLPEILEVDKQCARGYLLTEDFKPLDSYSIQRSNKEVYFTHVGLIRLILERINPELWNSQNSIDDILFQ